MYDRADGMPISLQSMVVCSCNLAVFSYEHLYGVVGDMKAQRTDHVGPKIVTTKYFWLRGSNVQPLTYRRTSRLPTLKQFTAQVPLGS